MARMEADAKNKASNEKWTVERGEYSDHYIHATFDRKADAIACKDDINAGIDSGSDLAFIGTIRHYTPGSYKAKKKD